MLKRSFGALLQRLRPAIVERYWSRAFAGGGVGTWLAEPAVRRYVNAAISGSAAIWPIEWLAARYPDGFKRAVSLGCGDGALERDLRRKGLCGSALGIDLSLGALALARSHASAATPGGLEGIRYARCDLDALALAPGAFDIALFHQALHHVRRLETCLAEVARCLAPGGVLYLDEYVGPSRSEWRKGLLDEAQEVYQRLPPAVRRRRRLSLPIDWRDPSEAVRSAEILPVLGASFETFLRRDYGGSFLSVIYPHLDLSHVSPATREATLATVIAAERQHLSRGGSSYYTVLLARPR